MKESELNMMFSKNGRASIGDFQFTIYYNSFLDGVLMDKPYSLHILDTRPLPDHPTKNLSTYTNHSHRFSTPEAAESFCQDVAAGKLSLQQLIKDEENAVSQLEKRLFNQAEHDLADFVQLAKNLNVDPTAFAHLFKSLTKLNHNAQKHLLFNEELQKKLSKDFFASKTLDNTGEPMTLKQYIDKIQNDTDILIEDNNQYLHVMPCVMYLSENDILRGYSHEDWEKWALDLPVISVNDPSYPDRVILKSGLSFDETTFLLDKDNGYETEEWQLLSERATYAGADFGARLALIKEGKSFEVPFDGVTMDVVDPNMRSRLYDLLLDHNSIFVATYPDNEKDLYVYALDFDKDGKHFTYDSDTEIPVKMSEPGMGLASFVQGKVCWAEHVANKAREEARRNIEGMNNPEKEAERV